MFWQYRTILFEFHKDGLLGDKYVDDEEVEKILNEQGEQGWELVSVSAVQEGLLTFFKQIRLQPRGPVAGRGDSPAELKEAVSPKPLSAAASPPSGEGQSQSGLTSQAKASRAGEPQPQAPKKRASTIGEIKIS